jgi:hypothetical protein
MNVQELEEKNRALETKIKQQEEVIRTIASNLAASIEIQNTLESMVNQDEANSREKWKEYDEKIVRLQETVYKLVGTLIYKMNNPDIIASNDVMGMFRRIHSDLFCNDKRSCTKTSEEKITTLFVVVGWLTEMQYIKTGDYDKFKRDFYYLCHGYWKQGGSYDWDKIFKPPTMDEKIKRLQTVLYQLIGSMFDHPTQSRTIYGLLNYMEYGVHYDENWYSPEDNKSDIDEESDCDELDDTES